MMHYNSKKVWSYCSTFNLAAMEMTIHCPLIVYDSSHTILLGVFVKSDSGQCGEARHNGRYHRLPDPTAPYDAGDAAAADGFSLVIFLLIL